MSKVQNISFLIKNGDTRKKNFMNKKLNPIARIFLIFKIPNLIITPTFNFNLQNPQN